MGKDAKIRWIRRQRRFCVIDDFSSRVCGWGTKSCEWATHYLPYPAKPIPRAQRR